MWSTKTCITSLQHIPVNLPSNSCQSYIPLTEIHSGCHQKPFPHGRDTAKLWLDWNWLHSRIHSQSRPCTRKGTRLGHRLCGWAKMPHVSLLKIVRVRRVLRLKSFLQCWKDENQTHLCWFTRVELAFLVNISLRNGKFKRLTHLCRSGLIPRAISMPRYYWLMCIKWLITRRDLVTTTC